MPELVIKTLLAIAVLAVLVGLFILGYLLNKKVPRPEGCDLEKTDLPAGGIRHGGVGAALRLLA